MPVSIIVGGQFGSEGKGKVALEVVRRDRQSAAAVRVGGTNSGHTSVDGRGITRVLRQLPAACVDRSVDVVLPPGSYIDLEIFQKEVDELGLGPQSVFVDPSARMIDEAHKQWEAASDLGGKIGSTQSGTGASVLALIGRNARNLGLPTTMAKDVAALKPFLRDTSEVLRGYLDAGKRIVIEGTQGFGLSPLHGGFWPKATSRDTTAAGFLSEAGLSPLDVDDVTMVIRCHPIRVAGDSGPLVGETQWDKVAEQGGLSPDLKEYTTVTKRVRRVGRFDPALVRRAIVANRPTRIVLNHLDYIDKEVRSGVVTRKALAFVHWVENELGAPVDWLGISPSQVLTSWDPDHRSSAGQDRALSTKH